MDQNLCHNLSLWEDVIIAGEEVALQSVPLVGETNKRTGVLVLLVIERLTIVEVNATVSITILVEVYLECNFSLNAR
jgi:hypothetical protein